MILFCGFHSLMSLEFPGHDSVWSVTMLTFTERKSNDRQYIFHEHCLCVETCNFDQLMREID